MIVPALPMSGRRNLHLIMPLLAMSGRRRRACPTRKPQGVLIRLCLLGAVLTKHRQTCPPDRPRRQVWAMLPLAFPPVWESQNLE